MYRSLAAFALGAVILMLVTGAPAHGVLIFTEPVWWDGDARAAPAYTLTRSDDFPFPGPTTEEFPAGAGLDVTLFCDERVFPCRGVRYVDLDFARPIAGFGGIGTLRETPGTFVSIFGSVLEVNGELVSALPTQDPGLPYSGFFAFLFPSLIDHVTLAFNVSFDGAASIELPRMEVLHNVRIPEPHPLALALAGMIGLVLTLRRRMQAAEGDRA